MEPPLLSREVEGPGKGAIFENSPVVSIYVSEEAVFLRTADFEGCLKALPTRPPPLEHLWSQDFPTGNRV